MIHLSFTAVDLGDEYDYEERFVLYCPYTGNNLLEVGWVYPPELLYIENNMVGEPDYCSSEFDDLYQEFLLKSENEDSDYFHFLDYLSDVKSEDTTLMQWVVVHPDGDLGDFVSVIYRNYVV